MIGFVCLTAVMTWPWVLHLRDTCADPGDPYLHSWVLWWDFHQTFSDPLNLFNANIFYPLSNTLAFTESNYGIALLFFPLYAAGFRPLTVHSIATFLGFAFCGYGTFRLTRTLTASTAAAWIAGIAFAFAPFRFHVLSQVTYVWAGWMPLLLEALVLFAWKRSWKCAAWLSVTFTMNALTSLTWMSLSMVPLLFSAALLVGFHQLWRDRRFWIRGAVAAVGSLLILCPFLLPYLRVSKMYGFIWGPEVVTRASPTAWNWLVADDRLRLWRGVAERLRIAGPRLFPGLVAPLLALASFLVIPTYAAGLRQLGETVGEHLVNIGRSRLREAFWLGWIWTITGFLLSLGMNSAFFRFLFDNVFIFRSMREPARAAMVASLGLSLLAGVGAVRLLHLTRRTRTAIAVAVLISVLLLIDIHVAPMRLTRGAADPDELALWLRQRPMRGGIVELPTGTGVLPHLYILRAADHQRPLINATSTFLPKHVVEINDLSRESPMRPELLDALERVPTSYLIIHNDLLDLAQAPAYELFLARGLASHRLRFIRRLGAADVYALSKTEPEAQIEQPSGPFISLRDWAASVAMSPDNLAGLYLPWSQRIYRLRLVAEGKMPRYQQVIDDTKQIGVEIFAGDEPQFTNREFQLAEHLAREKFKGFSDDQFLQQVMANAGITFSAEEQEKFKSNLNASTAARANLLVAVASDQRFIDKERDRSLVLIHFFAYLHRNPADPPDKDMSGFEFWLAELRKHPNLDLGAAFSQSIERHALIRGQ